MALVDTLVVKLLVQGREQLTDAEAAAALLDATTKKLTTSTQKATGASNENAATNERVTRAIRTTTNEFAKFVGAQDKASGAALKLANGLDRVARFTRELQLDEAQSSAVKQLVIDKYNLEIAAANKAADATKAYGETVQQSSEHIAAYVAEIARIKPIYDTVYAAGLKFGQAQKEINLLLRAGELTADQAAVSLAAATKAYDDVATAAGNASRALKGAVPPSYAEFLTEVAAYETKVEGLAQTYDKVYAAGLRYKQVQQEVNLLVGAGRISEAQAAAALAEAADAYDKVATAAGNAARAAKDAVPPSYAEFVDQLKAYEKEVDGLRLKYVPLVALEKQHEAELAAIAKAAALGNTVFKTQEEHEAALLIETQRYDSALKSVSSNLDHTSNIQGKATQTTGQLNAAVTNMGFQLNDIASGLLSGQSPFTILVQQGGQVIQAFAQGGGVGPVLKGVKEAIAGMITPTTLAVTALAALAVGFAVVLARAAANTSTIKQFNNALGTIGDDSSKTIKGMEDAALALRNVGVAAEDANKFVADLARNTKIDPAFAKEITDVAIATSRLRNVDVAQGMKDFQAAMDGGIQTMVDFAFNIHAIDKAEAGLVLTMAQEGRGGDALNRVFRDIRDTSKGFAANTDESTKAAEKFRSAWNGLLDALAKGGAFKLAQENLTQLAVDLTNLITKGQIFSDKFMEAHGLSGAGAPLATGTVPSATGVPQPGLGTTTPTYGGDYGTLLSGNKFSVRPGVVMTPNAPAYIDTMSNVVTQLPPGFGIVITSIGRQKSNSSVGASTAHNPAAGGAFDYKIINTTTGQEYPNTGTDTTPGGLYGQTFKNAAAFIAQKYPQLLPFMENGALFGSMGGPISPSSPADIGHIGFRGAPQIGLATSVSGGPFQGQDPKAVAALDAVLAEQNRLLGQNVTVNQTLSGPIATARTAAYAAYNQELNTSHNDQLAQTAGLNAYKNSLIEQNVALDTANQKVDLTIKGQEGVANAYLESEQAGIKAAAAEQARVDVLEHGGDVAQQTQRILSQQAAEALTASAKAIPALQLQYTETSRLAEATKGGAAAQHEMELQNQATAATHDVVAKAEATGNAAYIEEAKRLEAVTLALIKKNDAAQTALELQKQINSNKDQIEVNKVEAQYAFQTSEEIQRQVSLLQAKQFLISKNVDLSSDEAKNYLASVDALGKSNIALAEQQRAAQRLNDVLTSVGQTVDQAITQNVSNALSGKKITAWHTIFKDALVQLESQLISMSVIKPAIGSLLGMLDFGGAASNFGTFFGGGGGASLLSGIFGGSLGGGGQGTSGATGAPITLEQRDKEGNLTGTLSTVSSVGSLANTGSGLFGGGGSGGLFGSGGISGFVNNTIGTSLGFAPSGLLPGSGAGAGIFTNAATGATSDIAGSGVAGGLFGGTTLGGFLGGVGAGATVGSLANMFIGPMIGGGKSTGGMIGSTGGALAGAIIGSIVPGIGTLLGGIIGGAGGGLLGGFFGPKPANNAGSGSLNLATGQLGAFTSGGVAANDQAAQGILQPISTTLANITQILGASVLPQATLIAQAGSRDGIKVNIASGEGVKSFTGSDAGAVVQEVAKFLFEHRDLSALSPTLQKAVGSLDINQIQDTTQLTTAVNFSKIYDTIVTAADSAFQSIESGAQQAGPFEQAMSQITDTFAQLTTQAQQYGLSIDPINAALAEATKRINVDFAKAVDAAYNTATGNDFLNGVQSLVDNYASMAREASAIGASTTVFDKLGQTFDASLKTMFAQLNSTQLNAVIAAFGDLGNDLPALATSARDAALASEALIAAQNQQAQIYQNQQDSYTAANQGFLAQLRDLDKARIATQATNKSLGLGSDQDAQVQETEHRAALNILQALTNDQLEAARKVLADLNPAFAQWVDEAKAATIATQQQADAQARSNAILAAGLQIRQYLNAQETGPDYTSPQSRLEAARSQFQTQLGLAQGGDVNALQGITGIADQLKAALQGWFASSAPGAAEWEAAKAALAALPGVPNAQDTATNAIVDAINDNGTATVSTISDVTTATAQQIIGTTIATNQAIVDNARATSRDIVSATGDSSTRIVTTAIDTSNSIVANGIAGAASIVGATTTGLDLATGATLTSAAQITAASNNTATAVNIAADVTKSGTMALLDSNAANAATLIAGSKEDTLNLLAQQEANSGALLTANAVQSAALVDQNSRDAAAVVATTNTTAASIVAQNDNASKQIIDTATATGNASVATANANTTDMIWTANATSAEVAARNEASVHALDVSTQAGTTTLLAQGRDVQAAQAAQAESATTATVGAAYNTTDILGTRTEAASANIAATTQAGTNALVAKGDAQIAALQSIAGVTVGDVQVGTAIYNIGNEITQSAASWSSAIYGQIAAYGTWAVQSSEAWSNAIVQTIGYWGNAINYQTWFAGDSVTRTVAAWSQLIASTTWAGLDTTWRTVDAWGNAVAGTVAAWGNATCQNIAAWGNAEVGNANNNANNTINMLAAVANAISNSIFSSGSTQIAATYGSSSNEIGATFANGNSIIGAIGSMSVANIAAIYGSANSIVGQTGVIPAYVDQARNDNNWWLGTINGTLNGINSNEVAWNQNLYNKLQEILNNIVGWNQNLWNELHIIHEYMQLLTEVTINFDEFMAGSQGANTDIMNQIQDTLRRQAFG